MTSLTAESSRPRPVGTMPRGRGFAVRFCWRCAWFVLCGVAVPGAAFAGDLVVLSEKTWDEYLPKGKEVDAIYGDFVLRNDKIVCVIANPIAGRNANMTVRDVAGCVIDLTVRGRQSDQLSAYYPGSAGRFAFRLTGVSAQGRVRVTQRGSDRRGLERHVVHVTEGRLVGSEPSGLFRLEGERIELQCVAAGAADRPEVRLTYSLKDGDPYVEIRTEYMNRSDKPLKVAPVDTFRADRTFQTAPPGDTELVWFYDKWWGQAYGVTSSGSGMRLSGSPLEPRVIEFRSEDQLSVELAAGGTLEVTRQLFPANDLIQVRALAQRIVHPDRTDLRSFVLSVRDAQGDAVAGADIDLTRDDKPYGNARTDASGRARLDLPAGKYAARVAALARGQKELSIDADGSAKSGEPAAVQVTLEVAPRVVANIRDADGKPIPCKVQFIGVAGTPNPDFFPDTGEHAVRNLYYSHNGQFTQELPPGKYDVLVSYGPEYDLEKRAITVAAGQTERLDVTLRRVVNTPGWVSTDFHSHSSPSGDNVSSQLGRVLNLIAEHIEFAPCTEHNRLDSYSPHLKALGVESVMGTCTGIELTGTLGTVNHQNAFPLVLKPRQQDNGAPERDGDPEVQIKRLALWDDNSDKLVQSNHPDMGEMFFDKDGDGVPDGGFKGMFQYQDVIEVHPIHNNVLEMSPYRPAQVVDRVKNTTTTMQYNNSIFNWMQMINQGRRLPGVVNTDAHYNFHGSGWIRNYVRCDAKSPSEINPMDIVHACEKGNVVMTNGPYLEVTLHAGEVGAASGGASKPAEPRQAIPGDDLALPNGYGTLHVRVQCPNWFDVNRVQVLLNGRRAEKLNWTRADDPGAFSDAVVKFDRRIPIEFKDDTHVIVVATGANLQLGPAMGPEYGKHAPTAVSNPIFVDVDGNGFKANGDTLDHALPVKGGKPLGPVQPTPPAASSAKKAN